jgi:hypothetical protein
MQIARSAGPLLARQGSPTEEWFRRIARRWVERVEGTGRRPRTAIATLNAAKRRTIRVPEVVAVELRGR